MKIIARTLLVLLALLAALLLSMRLGWWNPDYDRVRAAQAPPPSRFVQLGEVRLHVRDEGAGPVVLMLHSSMTNLREWDDWAALLKAHYRVIRLDWPPYGLSVDPRPSRGMPGVVELLEQFVAAEHLEHFSLVATSSGATIAVLYAARHPAEVTALALSTLPLAAPPPTRVPPLQSLVQWTHDTLVPNYYPRFYYRMSLAGLYGDPTRLRPETVEWYYETNNIAGGFARVRAYYQANLKAVWSKGAAREAAMIRAPILLQWGDADPVLATALAESAQRQFANAPVTLIHYPDAGHYLMLEIPQRSGRDLVAFLDRVHDRAQAGP